MKAVAQENRASWPRPRAFDGERSYVFATFPARGAAMLNLQEVVVRNWNGVKVTDQDVVIDPGLALMVYDWGLSIPLDTFREHGAFGPEVGVPASASSVDRLVGLLGRIP